MGRPFEQTAAGSFRVLAAVLAIIVLAVYFPPRDAEFVYDSRYQILSHDFLHDRENWRPTITFQVLAWDVLDFNRPVHLAVLMLDSMVWERKVFGYRLTSALLHAATVVLLFALLLRWLDRPGPRHAFRTRAAFAAALLFAVHPVLTEAVCEPSYREDLLAALFCALALLCASAYDPRKPGTGLLLLVCPLAALLGAGSKESAVVIPFALAAYWATSRQAEPERVWIVTLAVSFLATAGFLTARFLLETADSKIFTDPPDYPGGSFQVAMLLQPRILALYLQNTVWPLQLCADYGVHSLRLLTLPVALGAVAVVAAGLGWWMWKDRRALVPVVLIAGSLLPVLNLIPIYRPAADRYLYLPLIGVAMLVALLLDRWLSVHGRARFPATALVVVLIAGIFTAINIERQQVWKTNLALWEDTAERNPRSYTAATGLGGALLRAGRLAEAEAAYARALELSDGKRGDLWAEIAVLMSRQGRTDDALQALRKAIELDQKMADPARAVETMHLTPDTAAELEKLIELDSRAGTVNGP